MGFLIDSPPLATRLEEAVSASLPRFAWALETRDGQLAWRSEEGLIQPEPGTTALQRFSFRLIGRLPLGHLF
jgi:hypothetical protein